MPLFDLPARDVVPPSLILVAGDRATDSCGSRLFRRVPHLVLSFDGLHFATNPMFVFWFEDLIISN